MNKTILRLEFKNNGNGKEYKVKAICNSMINAINLEDYLSGLYNLIL